MTRVREAIVPVLLTFVLVACGPPLKGTYADVKDVTRYYKFSAWSQSWENHYGDQGTYTVDGKALAFQGGGGLTGEIVSEEVVHLNDAASWTAEEPFNTYRRLAD